MCPEDVHCAAGRSRGGGSGEEVGGRGGGKAANMWRCILMFIYMSMSCLGLCLFWAAVLTVWNSLLRWERCCWFVCGVGGGGALKTSTLIIHVKLLRGAEVLRGGGGGGGRRECSLSAMWVDVLSTDHKIIAENIDVIVAWRLFRN